MTNCGTLLGIDFPLHPSKFPIVKGEFKTPNVTAIIANTEAEQCGVRREHDGRGLYSEIVKNANITTICKVADTLLAAQL